MNTNHLVHIVLGALAVGAWHGWVWGVVAFVLWSYLDQKLFPIPKEEA